MSPKIIAILRGVQPHEVLDIGQVLIDCGIDAIEVPLNSPDPLNSIGKLARSFNDQALIGAGTVLSAKDVEDVANAGGKIIVSPDCNPDVILATKKLQLLSYPGVQTPTECFSAIRAKADGLKIFPASLIGPQGLMAIKAVLPKTIPIYAVGGVHCGNFDEWVKAGAYGFGLGTAIYKPGLSPKEVAERAKTIMDAFSKVVT